MSSMKIAIASDHAGFTLKEHIKTFLREQNFQVIDLGPTAQTRCDYPDYALSLCQHLQTTEVELGILICGTGVGMSIAANKCSGIRAALISDVFSAQATRAHNDSNVLCLGARVIGVGLAESIVQAWCGSEFEGGRHQKRIDKMMALESRR